ncbi:hypothetical protein ACOME3_006492 [Neoechinorhynchus agilis]
MSSSSVSSVDDNTIYLDSEIRTWVFIPIAFITLLVGIIRHYVSIMITSSSSRSHRSPENIRLLKTSHLLLRSRMLRENGSFLPRESFEARKRFLTDEENGYLNIELEDLQNTPPSSTNPAFDPTTMTEMLKGNLINVLPMFVVGGWINYAFNGFLCTRVPFPLTHRFKPMLHRGVEHLQSLDPSWVSSISWYALNVFGLRSIYNFILGENNAADQTRIMQDQMIPLAQGTQHSDLKKMIKAERDALLLTEHESIFDSLFR